MNNKVLYFEGAGSATPETVAAGVGNCRIRTAFHARDGRLVYLEIYGFTDCIKTSPTRGRVCGWVEYAHWITDSRDDCNRSRINGVFRTGKSFAYTLDNILDVVRRCGGDFDAVRVLPDLAGYHVFRGNYAEGPNGYNYGDEFVFDETATAKRDEIRDEVYRLEYEARKNETAAVRKLFDAEHINNGIWPNFSLWVPNDRPDLLKWEIHMNYKNCAVDIDINAGSVRECVKRATGWDDETYGDFAFIYNEK